MYYLLFILIQYTHYFILDIELENIDIFKNGQKMKANDNIHIDISDDIVTLLVDKVSFDDEASYTIRVPGSEKDHGEVEMTVNTDASTSGNER